MMRSSPERFSIAAVRKPVCSVESSAPKLVGPAASTRLARSQSESPSVRTTSAYSPSLGRYMTAKSVVTGGRMYFLAMDSACVLTARSRFLRARSSPSRSARSEAETSRSNSSTGNLLSTGRYISPSLAGRTMAKSTMELSRGLSLTLRRYCSGASICSSRASSCASPQVPRSLTFVNTRRISATEEESPFISPTLSYIFSSRSVMRAKESESLPSMEEVSFSSTVLRMRSRFCALTSTTYLRSSASLFWILTRRLSVVRSTRSSVRAL